MNAPEVVLVTGASRFLGGSLVSQFAADDAVQRVIAIDDHEPLGRRGAEWKERGVQFLPVDITDPVIRDIVVDNEVDTVVHPAVRARPASCGGRGAMKDYNVIGSMQLFAACHKAPSVRRVVVRSSSAVYGSSPKDPAKFTEEMSALHPPRSAFARDLIDVEAAARGLARRRLDATVAILRFAPIVGPRLARRGVQYLGSHVTPIIAGRDPRVQLVHEQDTLSALTHAAATPVGGTFNIAGDGILSMSQAIRRSGRVELPLPPGLFRTVGRALMFPPIRELATEQLAYFSYGCGLDTTRMRGDLRFEPRWSTVEAFDDWVGDAAMRPVIDPRWIDAAETKLLGLVSGRSGEHR